MSTYTDILVTGRRARRDGPGRGGVREPVVSSSLQIDLKPSASLFGTAVAVIVCAGLCGLGLAISARTGQPLNLLLRDANAIAKAPFYFALLETLGFVMLASSGAIALFTGFASAASRSRGLLLGLGALTIALAMDDALQLHENAWRVGLTEKKLMALYGLAAAGTIAANLRAALTTPLALAAAFAAFMAVSAAIDLHLLRALSPPDWLEDMLELCGFVFWGAYLGLVAHEAVRASQHKPAARRATGPKSRR